MKANELKEILKSLEIGLPVGKTIVDKTECFYFLPNKIVTYNDNISVFAKSEINLQKEPFGISSEDLLLVINRLGEKEIELSAVKGKLIIKAKGVKIKFAMVTEIEEFIGYIGKLDFMQVKKKLKPLPKDFMEGVALCLDSVAKLDQEIVLTGLYFKNDKIIGSDRFRISQYSLSKSIRTSFILPRNAAIDIKSYQTNSKLKFYNNDESSWVYFGAGPAIIACRKIAGKYLPIKKHFNVKGGKDVVLPKALLKVIEVAEVMSEGEFDSDKTVDIEFNKPKEVLVKSSKENGEVIGNVKARRVKIEKNFAFRINPIFLNKISKTVKVMKVGDDRVLFERENFKHVISLR